MTNRDGRGRTDLPDDRRHTDVPDDRRHADLPDDRGRTDPPDDSLDTALPDGRPHAALPDGRLRKDRVVEDPRDPLAEVLDRELTGYGVFESQETLLLDAEGRGVLTFRDGVPELAYHTGTDRGGPAALADLATPGPYHVELYELPARRLAALGDPADLRVPPGMPAERLAGDPALAASTRRAAPASRRSDGGARPDEDGVAEGDRATGADRGAVEAFLEDEAKIAAIRERARREAEARADEWDLPTDRE